MSIGWRPEPILPGISWKLAKLRLAQLLLAGGPPWLPPFWSWFRTLRPVTESTLIDVAPCIASNMVVKEGGYYCLPQLRGKAVLPLPNSPCTTIFTVPTGNNQDLLIVSPFLSEIWLLMSQSLFLQVPPPDHLMQALLVYLLLWSSYELDRCSFM